MNDSQTIRNEPQQKAIDHGSAAFLRLPPDLVELAKATAKQMAKDGGDIDWRVRLEEACNLVRRVALREKVRRWAERSS